MSVPYRHLSQEEWEPRPSRLELWRRRRRNRLIILTSMGITLLFLVAVLSLVIPWLTSGGTETPRLPMLPTTKSQDLSSIEIPEWIDQELLDLGGSRSGQALGHVNDIAVHYV